MATDPPTPSRRDSFATDAARAVRRQREANLRKDAARQRLRLVFMLFAAAALVALVMDARNMSRRLQTRTAQQPTPRKGDVADIEAGMHDARYVDPSGLFSLVPPRHWVKVKQPPGSFFNVVFQGPHGMDMSILVSVTNGITFNALVDNLRQRERALAAETHLDFAYAGPHRAVKGTVQLFRSKLLLLDFLTGDLAHHVQFSTPPELFDEYEPVFLRLMQTYEPGRILRAP